MNSQHHAVVSSDTASRGEDAQFTRRTFPCMNSQHHAVVSSDTASRGEDAQFTRRTFPCMSDEVFTPPPLSFHKTVGSNLGPEACLVISSVYM